MSEMSYSLVDLMAVALGLVLIVFNVIQFRRAYAAAERFRALQASGLGDSATRFIYTELGVRVASVGGVLVGILLIALGLTGQFS